MKLGTPTIATGTSEAERARDEMVQRTASQIGFAIEHLRILSGGPLCGDCWGSDGELVPAVGSFGDPWGGSQTNLCESCANREPGDQGEDDGPSGPSDQDRFEARRDSGRRA